MDVTNFKVLIGQCKSLFIDRLVDRSQLAAYLPHHNCPVTPFNLSHFICYPQNSSQSLSAGLSLSEVYRNHNSLQSIIVSSVQLLMRVESKITQNASHPYIDA